MYHVVRQTPSRALTLATRFVPLVFFISNFKNP